MDSHRETNDGPSQNQGMAFSKLPSGESESGEKGFDGRQRED